MAEIFEPGFYYHIFNRGNNKENIFIEDKNYNYFLTLIKKHLISIADIYAYCLLKNHFHILLKIKDNDKIPERYKEKIHQPFSNLFNAYTKAVNKAYHRTGSLFQEHLHKIRITDVGYLRQVIAYIHLNPLKHEFTAHFDNYKHSSFRLFSSNEDSFLQKDEVILLFEDLENFKYWHDVNKIRLDGKLKEIEKLDN